MNPHINKTELAYAPQLSTNYEMLYEHLQKGIHVICFMDCYMPGYENNEYKYRKLTVAENLNYFQGIIFGSMFDEKEKFTTFCKKYNLTFLPN